MPGTQANTKACREPGGFLECPRMKLRISPVAAVLALMTPSIAAAADANMKIFRDPDGKAVAALVDDSPLIYLTQVSPQGGDDVEGQLKNVIGYISHLLAGGGSSLSDIARLHLYAATPAAADEALRKLGSFFPEAGAPPVSVVQTALPDAKALIAIDVVARQAKLTKAGPSGDDAGHLGVLPKGRRVFISGQAEKGDGTLASATTKTMESLETTLKFLGMEKKHAVQVKCFLTPMKDVAVARDALTRFFAPLPLPPATFVEWDSTLPIEIEMVAGDGGVANRSGPGDARLAFVTPPGMKASPVYCRVAEVSGGPLVFIGSLWGKDGADAEGEVRGVFAQMKTILAEARSDLLHLVKATYYVSDDEVSKKLNDIRPEFYDPQRPPAASKAVVKGVGRAGRTLNLDMIAAPAATP